MKSKSTQKSKLLLKFSNRLTKAFHSGALHTMSAIKRKSWLKTIKRLSRQLNIEIPNFKLSSIAKVAVLALGLVVGTSQASAQSSTFELTDTMPANITGGYYNSFPCVGDIDADGDLDMFVGQQYNYYAGLGYTSELLFLENTGSATAPNFAAPVTNAFNSGGGYYFGVPDLVDIDGDGDLDLFVGERAVYSYGGSYKAAVLFYENIGTPSAPNFASPIGNPFGIDSGYLLIAPEFGDIDGDGDMDLILGQGNNYTSGDIVLAFQENTGTSTSPAFGPIQQNNFGTGKFEDFSFPHLVDLDGDNDLDLLVGGGDNMGGNNGSIILFENVGTASAPVFDSVARNPWNLNSGVYLSNPESADLDGDGDLDMLIAGNYSNYSPYGYEGVIFYHENTGWINTPPTISNQAAEVLCVNQGVQSVSLSGIGDVDVMQTLSLTATSTNTAVLADPMVNFTSPGPTATLDFMPTMVGTIPIDVTVTDGGVWKNEATTTFNVFAQVCVGFNDDLNSQFKVYPNPATAQVSIELDEALAQEDVSFTINDVSGKSHLSGNSSSKMIILIDVSALSSGVYFVKLESAEKLGHIKLLID